MSYDVKVFYAHINLLKNNNKLLTKWFIWVKFSSLLKYWKNKCKFFYDRTERNYFLFLFHSFFFLYPCIMRYDKCYLLVCIFFYIIQFFNSALRYNNNNNMSNQISCHMEFMMWIHSNLWISQNNKYLSKKITWCKK